MKTCKSREQGTGHRRPYADRPVQSGTNSLDRSQYLSRSLGRPPVLPLRPEPAGGTTRPAHRRTLPTVGEPLSYLTGTLYHPGTEAYTTKHPASLQDLAQHGLEHTGSRLFLQRPRMRCFCPRPHALPGRETGCVAHRTGLEKLRNGDGKTLSPATGRRREHRGNHDAKRQLRALHPQKLYMSGICHPHPAVGTSLPAFENSTMPFRSATGKANRV